MRELIGASRSSSWGVTRTLGDDLSYRLEREIVSSLLSHHIAQKRPVDRQQRRALLGPRSVVSIEPVHDETELQARRERRWYLSLDDVNGDRSALHVVQHRAQTIHVERILQHIAIRLHKDREARELSHRLKEIERLQALEPQRHSSPGVPTWQEKRTRSVHPEPRSEQRRRSDLLHHQLLCFRSRKSKESGYRCRSAEIRHAEHHTVVRRLDLHFTALQAVARTLRQCHSPRSVDSSTECRMKHHADRTRLVAEVLDDDVPVVGYDCCRCSLCTNVLRQSVSGGIVAAVFLLQERRRNAFGKLSSQLSYPVAQLQ